ncbi:MAG TPA: phage tail sheath subtilisin-like domain-containing protein [Longimicrobium sp.]
MPEYLAPGVYVEEVELGPRPIEGVSTSTTGFVGAAVRGPVNKPVLVTNVGEYQRIFGGYLGERLDGQDLGDRRWLPYSVEGFFQNGGSRAYVVRVANLPGVDDVDPAVFAHTAYSFLPERGQARRFLASKAEAGAKELDLAHWVGLATGSGLVIGEGSEAEYVVVTGFGTKVQVEPALAREHRAGTGVTEVAGAARALDRSTANAAGASQLFVAQRSGLTNNNWYMLGEGDAAEVVRVGTGAGSNSPGNVATQTPLRRSHGAGEGLRATTVPGAATLTLNGAAAKDATSIKLSGAGVGAVKAGDWLQVTGDGSQEQTQSDLVLITGTVAAGEFTIADPLAFAHASGNEVLQVTVTPGDPVAVLAASSQVTLSDDAGIGDDAVLLIDDGPRSEFVEVVGPLASKVATLRNPLLYPHVEDTPVRVLDTPGSTTSLAARAESGAFDLTVAEPEELAPEDVIELFDGEQTEYGVIASVEEDENGDPTGVIFITRGLRYPHPEGTLVRRLEPRIRIDAGPARPNPDLWPEPGSWGNQVRVTVSASSVLRTVLDGGAAADAPFIQLRTANGIEAGTVLRLPGNRYAVARLVEGNRVYLDGRVPATLASGGTVESEEFRITFEYGGATEVFDNLSTDERHSRYFVEIINRSSKLVHVTDLDSDRRAAGAEKLPLPTREWFLGGGSDGVNGLTPAAYAGRDSDDADRRTGLYALGNVSDISIVAVPGRTDPVVQQALIAHCERARYRFAVLDSRKGADLDGVQEQRSLYDSKYAALYYPWIQIYDPLRNGPVFAPPSGHVAGIYARTDQEVGVHKAPANQVVRQVGDLEATVNTGMQDILNPRGINAIRAFPGRGIRVWGARTISSDALWRYVNVRRLFIYLEHSIDVSTQYAVFEPNDRPLWNRLKASLTSFLTTTWRSGALQGATAAEAFFVRVGLGETMTQDDIDNGRVIILIGVAPVKPAEFVIFRIGQKVGGSEVAE